VKSEIARVNSHCEIDKVGSVKSPSCAQIIGASLCALEDSRSYPTGRRMRVRKAQLIPNDDKGAFVVLALGWSERPTYFQSNRRRAMPYLRPDQSGIGSCTFPCATFAGDTNTSLPSCT
jgi:hypothetical protein